MEQVLAVPRSRLEELNLLHDGFREADLEPVLEVVASDGRFLDRPLAEADPAWKQIIPYAVVTHPGPPPSVFLLRRLKAGGEPRLHDLLSIGVGGHINPDPQIPADRRVEHGLRREIEEELHCRGPRSVRPLGVLNDDSNEVGQVHYGLVFQVTTASRSVEVRETEVLRGEFVPLRSLRTVNRQLESWSRRLADVLLARPGWLRVAASGTIEREDFHPDTGWFSRGRA